MQPIDRLRETYKEVVRLRRLTRYERIYTSETIYNGMRLMCLDCNIISFEDIEVMEDEVNNSFD